MKFRKGFVSNSSSSSYIIALNKPIDEYDTAEKIMQFFWVDPDSTFWNIAKEITNYFLSDLEHYESLEDLEYDFGISDKKREKIKDFKHFYLGSISTDGEDLGDFIMNYIGINIDDEEMYMYFDGMF